MKPSEVIREARSLLFMNGWHQGSLHGPDNGLCALGALGALMSLPRSMEIEVAHNFVTQAMGQHIPIWNDAEGRTFDEVIDAFDRAEKLALIAEESDA